MATKTTANKTPEDPEQISFGQELIRKGTHMGALIIPGSYYLLGLDRAQMLAVMIPATILMIFIDLARLRNWAFWRGFGRKWFSPIIRQHELAGDFTGATYILLTVCASVALFPKPIAVAAMAFIIVGDTTAALIGRKFGTRRFFNGKSIEGTLACLGGTLAVAFLTPELARPVAVLGAVVAAIVEALPFGIDDNVTVPIISGLVMTLAERAMLFS